MGNLATGLMAVAVSPEQFADLLATEPAVEARSLVTLQAVDGVDPAVLADDARRFLEGAVQPGDPSPVGWVIDQDLWRQVAMIGAGISSVLLIASSLLVAGATAVVAAFLIGTAITEDMAAIGTLKAVGFGNRSIVASYGVQYLLVSVMAALAGVAVSYAALPALGTILRNQTGLISDLGFSPTAGAVSVIAVVVLVVIVVVLAGRRSGSITPIDALRGSASTHSFRRNHLPLASTRSRLNIVLGLKAALQRPGQAVLLAVVVGLAAFALAFSVGLSRFTHRDTMATLVVGPLPDLTVQVDRSADPATVLASIRDLPGVVEAGFDSSAVVAADGRRTQVRAADTLPADTVYVGRLFQHDNEVTMGRRLADRLGLGVGDEVTLSDGEAERRYLITGLTSSARELGLEVQMTADGYRSLVPDFRPAWIAIVFDPGADPEQMIDEVRHEVGPSLRSMTTAEEMSSVLDVYVTMVGALVAVIIGVSSLIVVLVIALVVLTMVMRTRRDFGVARSVGFTTADLSAQTLARYVPPVVAGTISGLVVAWLSIEWLYGGMLAGLGVYNVEGQIAAGRWVAIGVGVIGLAVLIIWLAAQRIRAVSPYRLLTA